MKDDGGKFAKGGRNREYQFSEERRPSDPPPMGRRDPSRDRRGPIGAFELGERAAGARPDGASLLALTERHVWEELHHAADMGVRSALVQLHPAVSEEMVRSLATLLRSYGFKVGVVGIPTAALSPLRLFIHFEIL